MIPSFFISKEKVSCIFPVILSKAKDLSFVTWMQSQATPGVILSEAKDLKKDSSVTSFPQNDGKGTMLLR